MLLDLPMALQDLVFQFAAVRARSLQALERRAVNIFAKTYAPERRVFTYVLLTKIRDQHVWDAHFLVDLTALPSGRPP